MNHKNLSSQSIQYYKEKYPPGTRIVLLSMDDPYAPVPPNTKGTVKFVDDMGTLHMSWDNGRTLGVIPGEDSFRNLSEKELEEERKSFSLTERIHAAESRTSGAELSTGLKVTDPQR